VGEDVAHLVHLAALHEGTRVERDSSRTSATIARWTPQIMATDSFVVLTADLLFVIVMLAHHRRHLASDRRPVRRSNSAKPSVRERPPFVIHDLGLAFRSRGHVRVMDNTEVLTDPRSPRQNGSLRRECLDHVKRGSNSSSWTKWVGSPTCSEYFRRAISGA